MRFAFWVFFAAPLGCGSVDVPPAPKCECPPGYECVDGACEVATVDPCADAASRCGAGDICVGGVCVDPSADGDGDGSPGISDCDDENPAIHDLTTLPCHTECGNGETVCAGGEWTPCSAPNPPCNCDAGAVNVEPCGFCGTQERPCVDGTWAEQAGECQNPGECVSGIPVPQSCGECGTAERPCSEACTLGDVGACVGPETPSDRFESDACRAIDPNYAWCNTGATCSDQDGCDGPGGVPDC